VRSSFEDAVSASSGGATVTRQAYIDTLAAWELMCSAAEKVLKLTAADAESYLLSKRIFPASGGTGVKERTVSSWFTRNVLYKMDKYRKVCLKVYFSSLQRDCRTLDSADAGTWLNRNIYRISTQGKSSIKAALEAFFKSRPCRPNCRSQERRRGWASSLRSWAVQPSVRGGALGSGGA